MTLLDKLRLHGEIFNDFVLTNLLIPLTRQYEVDSSYFDDYEVLYYTLDDMEVSAGKNIDIPESTFKIVRYTKSKNHFNSSWCFGFVKVTREGTVKWKGTFAGTIDSLFSSLRKYVISAEGNYDKRWTYRLTLPQAIGRLHLCKYTEIRALAKEVFECLLDQREWDLLGGVSGLSLHLSSLLFEARNKYLVNRKTSAEIFSYRNIDGEFVVFNSGLLDKYTNFIFLQFKVTEHFTPPQYDKCVYIEAPVIFTKLTSLGVDTSLRVLTLCDKEKFFFPDDKISLDDVERLDHMFTDRWDRFPVEVQNMSPDVLFTALKTSVELALKMNQIDKYFIIPYYNFMLNSVSYLIPLYVDSFMLSKPVCAITITFLPKEQVWAPATVLTFEMARANARLLNRIKHSWLLD